MSIEGYPRTVVSTVPTSEVMNTIQAQSEQLRTGESFQAHVIPGADGTSTITFTIDREHLLGEGAGDAAE